MRQYIGARYVPKFMGTYDATQSYEALCVVDNGMGTSYISTIPTPAGTPLTDTTHWAIYGASSGAIINLQNQINAIDTTIGDSSSGMIKDINDLDASVNTIETRLNMPRKFLLIGDSYMRGVDGDDNQSTVTGGGWGDRFKAKYETYGMTVDILPSGSGFNVASPSITWNNAINTYTSGMSADDLNSYTDVCIIGGWNDLWVTTGLDSAVLTTINNIRSKFKKANILLAPMTVQPSQGVTLLTYYRYAQKYGVDVNTKLINVLAQKDLTGLDGIHPTANGYAYIEPYIESIILSGDCKYRLAQNTVYEASDGEQITINVSATERGTRFYFISNDRNGLNKTNTDATISKSYTTSATNYIQVGSLNQLRGGGMVFKADGTYRCPFGTYFTTSDTIRLYAIQTGASGDKMITVNDVIYDYTANILPI